ncbi:hemicentin-2-like isoform X1 [Scylla paramamosain]|uniref:hemicentin-2-like isoform X1 n=1 Tax=Scylla paramamosain TaxID=85552 RepID=UPI003082AAA6
MRVNQLKQLRQKTGEKERMVRWSHEKHKTGQDKENAVRESHHKARGATMTPDVGVAAWAVVGSLLLAVTTTYAMSDAITDQEVTVIVDGVEGESASVPCDLFPSDPKDKVNLILWYKDDAKDPIYSYDARLAVFASERHHLKEMNLKGRIAFTPSPGQPIPHTLTLSRLSASDAGTYSCRVDFMRAQSTTRAARLRVVSPVESLIITDSGGDPVPPILSPVPEGGTLNLTCTARGGRPQPKVSWWLSESIIDDSFSSSAGGSEGGSGSVVSNTLIINPLTRAHAHSVLTCKAATAPVAVTTTKVTIDMYLRPLTVEITGAAVGGSVRAGDLLDLSCTARGSRPQPVISWYKGASLIQTQNTQRKDVTGVGGMSRVRVAVQRRDNEARITCRVSNPQLPLHTLQDHVVINVTFAPQVELRVGSRLEGTVVKKGKNLYLTCHVDANPPPHKLIFMHQGVEVRQDKTEHIMVNGNNLVLNKISRTQAGEYSCKATNSEGTGSSVPLNITVLYAPVCSEVRDVWGELGSVVRASCRVQAAPIAPIQFSWVWVTPSYSRRVVPALVTSSGTASSVNFTVPRDNVTEPGVPAEKLGVLQCWAQNSVGRQEKPCEVAVRKPAPPSPPINCTLTETGPEVVTVSCQPGDPLSMTESYLLQVCGAKNRKLCHNISSPVPRFVVPGLTYGRDYEVYVSSSTRYGHSPFRLVEAFTFKTAENRMAGSETSPPSLYTIIMFVGGVGAIIVLVIIVIALIRLRIAQVEPQMYA